MSLKYQSKIPFNIYVHRPERGDARTANVNDNNKAPILYKATVDISPFLCFGA